jgi:hypothetical protein
MWKAQAAIPQPPTEPSGEISVLNQSDKTKFLNGVVYKFGVDGKPIFEEA